jgi:hypothetical protein
MLLKVTGNNLLIMVGHYNIPKGIKTIFLKPLKLKNTLQNLWSKPFP